MAIERPDLSREVAKLRQRIEALERVPPPEAGGLVGSACWYSAVTGRDAVVANFKCAEASGQLKDSIGSGVLLDPINSPGYGATGPVGRAVTLAGRPQPPNHALPGPYFGGPVGSLWPAFSDALSVEAWVTPFDLGRFTVSPVVSKTKDPDTGAGGGWALRMRDDGSVQWFAYDTDSISSGLPIGVAGWYYLVGTFGNDRLRLYINAELVGETPALGTVQNAGANFHIGYEKTAGPGGHWYLAGAVDEVVVSNEELTEEQIQSRYLCIAGS